MLRLSQLARLPALALLASGCATAPTAPPATELTSATVRGDATRLYDDATRLEAEGRTDASLAAFREAQHRFGDRDRRGMSLAIYGRANALERAGRCREARVAYADYASFVRAYDPASAAMAVANGARCSERATPDPALRVVVLDISAHRDADALAAAGRASPSSPSRAWLDYYRAVALADLGRTNDAVDAFYGAAGRFEGDPWAQSICIYGAARALDDAHRCVEAERTYRTYASLVREKNPGSAAMALHVASLCL